MALDVDSTPERVIDLFVSYSTKDATGDAEHLVQDLEKRGVICWIAPRDIPQSAIWPVEIQKAIRSARLFLLVLSPGANESAEIIKEVNEAAKHRKPLYVARTRDIQPADGLGYHLSIIQFRDLFRNRSEIIRTIVQDVETRRRSVAPQPIAAEPVPQPTPPKSRIGLLAAGGALAVTIAAFSGWQFGRVGTDVAPAPPKIERSSDPFVRPPTIAQPPLQREAAPAADASQDALRFAQRQAADEERRRLAVQQAEDAERQRLAAQQAQEAERQRLAALQAEEAERQRLATQQAEEAERQRLAAQQAQEAERQRLAAQQAEEAERQRLIAQQAEEAERQRLAAQQAQEAERQRLAAQQAEEAERQRLMAQQAEAAERQQLAALPPMNPPPTPDQSRAEPGQTRLVDWPATRAQQVRLTQREMTRLGCYRGANDGRWQTAATQAALQRSAAALAVAAPEAPSQAFAARLLDAQAGLCPREAAPRPSVARVRPTEPARTTRVSRPATRPAARASAPRSRPAARSGCFTVNGTRFCQ